jgi:hypothetical protein
MAAANTNIYMGMNKLGDIRRSLAAEYNAITGKGKKARAQRDALMSQMGRVESEIWYAMKYEAAWLDFMAA